MKNRCLALLLGISIPVAASAGVVYEIEVTDHTASPPRTETTEMSVEGKMLKMGVASKGTQAKGDAIYRGDRREMVIVDHGNKSYVVMDEATMEAIAGQVGQAMAQMQEALKNVPEAQRAEVERMMKGRMPDAAPKRAPAEVRRTGEQGDQMGYPCVKYEVVRAGRVTQELWVTDWSRVEGRDEVIEVAEEMSAFFQRLRDALPQGGPFGDGSFDDSAMELIMKLDGFPVVTRDFDAAGELEGESRLRSAQRRTLDPSEFEPPAGYKRRSMGPGG